MVVAIEKDSNVHCETNEKRSFFKFKSLKPIKLVEDIEILKEIYRNSDKKAQCFFGNNIRKYREVNEMYDYII